MSLKPQAEGPIPQPTIEVATVSTASDSSVTEKVHDELVQHQLVPSEHLLDTTVGSVDLLLESRREYDISSRTKLF